MKLKPHLTGCAWNVVYSRALVLHFQTRTVFWPMFSPRRQVARIGRSIIGSREEPLGPRLPWAGAEGSDLLDCTGVVQTQTSCALTPFTPGRLFSGLSCPL